MLSFDADALTPVRTYFASNPTHYKFKKQGSFPHSWIKTNTGALFCLQQLLGSKGAEGKVRKGLDETNTPVAIKSITLEDRYVYTSEEITVLATLGRLRGILTRRTSDSTRHLYIIQTFIPGDCLFDRLHSWVNPYTTEEKLIIAINLTMALLTLFEQYQIVHGDVKPENVIVDNNLNVTLVDFGFSKILPSSASRIQGLENSHTPVYGAPEVVRQKIYSPASDIYALGQTFKLRFQLSTDLYSTMIAQEASDRPSTRQVLRELVAALRKLPTLTEKGQYKIQEIESFFVTSFPQADYSSEKVHPPTRTPWRPYRPS